MEHKSGKITESKTVSSYGKTKSHSFDSRVSGDEGVQQQVVGLENVSYSQGFTKETNDWEFSRVDIRMGAFVPGDMDYDIVFEGVRSVVKELVAVETDGLNGVEREPVVDEKDLDIINRCPGKSISMTYGLTMKAGGRDSEKVDVTRSVYIDDGNDLADEFLRLGEWIASWVSEELKRVKG